MTSPSSDPGAQTVAERLGGRSLAEDAPLFMRAHRRHPRVAWWWGRRTVDGVGSAVCYVCDNVMVQWSNPRIIPADLFGAVEQHRNDHLREMDAESTAQGD